MSAWFLALMMKLWYVPSTVCYYGMPWYVPSTVMQLQSRTDKIFGRLPTEHCHCLPLCGIGATLQCAQLHLEGREFSASKWLCRFLDQIQAPGVVAAGGNRGGSL